MGLSFQVKHYMKKETNTIDVDATVAKTAKVMASDQNAEGYVIVLQQGKPAGIVTERDIINRVLAKELNPSNIKVSAIMTTPLRTVDPDDDLLKAAQLMREHDVGKLVVMKDGVIHGIITAKEISQRCGEYVDRSVRGILQWLNT